MNRERVPALSRNGSLRLFGKVPSCTNEDLLLPGGPKLVSGDHDLYSVAEGAAAAGASWPMILPGDAVNQRIRADLPARIASRPKHLKSC